MLAWMHDADVIRYMGKDFRSMTIDDCVRFIEKSKNKEHDIHLAVLDDNDVYHGTVSLKNIAEGTAEFAIVIDRGGQGTGLAKYAVKEIIRIGFEERKLEIIYWNVLPGNRRAVTFYDKEYDRIDIMKNKKIWRMCIMSGYKNERIKEYIWYVIIRKRQIDSQIEVRLSSSYNGSNHYKEGGR